MIPKLVGTDFRGIGMVEVLWKAIYGIINFWISSSIQFHDSLHGFCAGRGIVTTTIEDNLLHNLISMMDTVLHSIFLDILVMHGQVTGPQQAPLAPVANSRKYVT